MIYTPFWFMQQLIDLQRQNAVLHYQVNHELIPALNNAIRILNGMVEFDQATEQRQTIGNVIPFPGKNGEPPGAA